MPKDTQPDKDVRKERHSGDAKSSVKGKAKKGGAGGKFTEGKPGDEINEAVVEEADPNYDSEEEELQRAMQQAKVETEKFEAEKKAAEEAKAKEEPEKKEEAPPKEPEKELTEEEKKELETQKKRAEIAAKVKMMKEMQAKKELRLNKPKYEDAPEMFGRHEYQCDLTKVEPIVGFRWTCTKLADYDICTEALCDLLPGETYTLRNHKGQTRKVTRDDFQMAKGQGFRPTDADGKIIEATRPKTAPFEVTLTRPKEGAELGMKTTEYKKGGQLVSEVVKGGLLDKWNEENPQQTVRKGDVISEVNGKGGSYKDLTKAKKVGLTVKMTIQPKVKEESKDYGAAAVEKAH